MNNEEQLRIAEQHLLDPSNDPHYCDDDDGMTEQEKADWKADEEED